MAKVRITLNDKPVEIEAGSTILAAGRQHGVNIPTLCHDPRLKPSAACRLCLVEVAGARNPVPACATAVAEGMVVRTNTTDLTENHRLALELLLSDHYGDCVAPCQMACPAGVDIQGYVALIANGEYQKALALIRKSNPLPLSVGRVCPRFCEAKCRRNIVDEPVSINALKRFAADYELLSGVTCVPQPKPATGHRVAIVGGGPAGLAAAYYLALEGHDVTIFDAAEKLGGMLRYGIPEYRLPKAILDKEIATITGLCREVRCGATLGRDYTMGSLRKDGFEAIFIALGAQASQKMRVDGENLAGVLSGIGFLGDVARGKAVDLGQRVVVVGGGNTAIDAARTAVRMGAAEVTILYRRSREEMPASGEEVEQAEQEGVRFQFLAAPLKLSGQNGKVTAVECIRMTLGEPDSSGRRRPVAMPASEFSIPVDTVIAAIGQTLEAVKLDPEIPVKMQAGGFFAVDEGTMATSVPGIFAGGDCTSGPATVIEAIAAGRRAALSIDQFVSGRTVTPLPKSYNSTKGELSTIDKADYDHVKRVPRTKMPGLDAERRKKDFAETELGLSEALAQAESARCLACGCQDVFECKLRELATEYQVDDTRFAGTKRHLPVKEEDHPHVVQDPNKCVLCGRCVRICDEVHGLGVWGFVRRGFATTIEPALGLPLAETNCDSCGECISACPTGALVPRINLPKAGPWQLETVETVCPYCGVGCNLQLHVLGDKIVKVTSPTGNPVDDGNLCQRGAFGPTAIHDLKRPGTPLVKRNDELVAATWEEAIALAAKGLKLLSAGGGDRVAVLASAQLTNEESYLVQKMARVALGTNNIGSLSVPTAVEGIGLGKSASTCSYDDILTSDLIVVYACDLAQDYPTIGSKVREAVARGSKLVTFSARQTTTDSLARISLKVNRRNSVDLLESMLSYILSYNLVDYDFVNARTTGFSEFAREIGGNPTERITDIPWANPSRIVEAIHLLIRARRPVIIVDANTISPGELNLINDLALVTGNIGREGAGVMLLRTPGNAQGLIDMGVSPSLLPGQVPITDKAARRRFKAKWGAPLPIQTGRDSAGIVLGIERSEIEGILAVGGQAAVDIGSSIFAMPIFSVLMDTVVPENPPYPSVFLPAATFAESEGTYTSCERRVQRLRRAMSPPAGKQNWEIIAALATALGYPMPYSGVSGIYKEIAEMVPFYKEATVDGPHAAAGGQWPFAGPGKFTFKNNAGGLSVDVNYEIAAWEEIRSILRSGNPR